MVEHIMVNISKNIYSQVWLPRAKLTYGKGMYVCVCQHIFKCPTNWRVTPVFQIQ